MFSSFNSVRSVITLFHSAKSQPSITVLNFLKNQASLQSSKKFDLEILTTPPTNDQLRTILKYLGGGVGKVSAIVPGANGVDEASNILQAAGSAAGDEGKLVTPITVDWLNGKAVLGNDEHGLKKLIEALNK
ncbi:thioredoxin-like protein [Lipomyces japonicus]|uniref:thioredoxin-like protein n=1 Tax=Lipomyces japonicus TaxID=56871 RepID=UPI0034CFB52C